MKNVFIALTVASVCVASGCAKSSTRVDSSATDPRLISSAVTFTTLDDGKDADSAVTVQLLSDNNELAAEVRSTGTEFDDHSTAPPLAMALMGPFHADDVQDSRLRLQLTPDGRDSWAFDVRLSLAFSDNRQQFFEWSGIRMDERSVERTLTLAGAGVE
jgi:hypothetical protein